MKLPSLSLRLRTERRDLDFFSSWSSHTYAHVCAGSGVWISLSSKRCFDSVFSPPQHPQLLHKWLESADKTTLWKIFTLWKIHIIFHISLRCYCWRFVGLVWKCELMQISGTFSCSYKRVAPGFIESLNLAGRLYLRLYKPMMWRGEKLRTLVTSLVTMFFW